MYLFLELKALERRGQKLWLMNIHLQDQEHPFLLVSSSYSSWFSCPTFCVLQPQWVLGLSTDSCQCLLFVIFTHRKDLLFVIFWMKHFSSVLPWVCSTLVVVTQLPVSCFVWGSVLKKLTVDQNGLPVMIGQNVPLEVLHSCSRPFPPKVKMLWGGSPSICGWHLSSVNSHKIEIKQKQR